MTTRLWIMSDLHLESEHDLGVADRFWPSTIISHDILILAGDTHYSCAEAVRWAYDAIDSRVLMIGGNHEFYGSSIDAGLRKGHEACHETGNWVRLLENGVSYDGDTRILGCTLWTDFDLHPDRMRNFANAARGSQDFSLITGFTPMLARNRHLESVAWLIAEFEKPHNGPTVVVTHHAPSRKSIPERFDNDPTSPNFASDLSWLIERFQPDLWIHGHVHDSFDYRIGRTRVVCNPRGYRNENADFRTDMVVEV